jgi:hypothetical protein
LGTLIYGFQTAGGGTYSAVLSNSTLGYIMATNGQNAISGSMSGGGTVNFLLGAGEVVLPLFQNASYTTNFFRSIL